MHKSIVLSEALSIPKKINNFILNDTNKYEEISKLILDKKIKYIVTVARGTSDCAALYASYMFAKHLGLPTYSMPPSIITLEKSKFDFSSALILIISQSGMSEDLIECEKKSQLMGATTILISNNDKSPMVNTSNIFFNRAVRNYATHSFGLRVSLATELQCYEENEPVDPVIMSATQTSSRLLLVLLGFEKMLLLARLANCSSAGKGCFQCGALNSHLVDVY